MKIKEVFEKQGYKNIKNRIIISSIIIIIAVIIFSTALAMTPKKCPDSFCFKDSFYKCKNSYWIKEDSKAAWYYQIIGKAGKNFCDVNVKLLKMKQGDIETESLTGKEMVCKVHISESDYPEENIKNCTGVLKEEIQDIIIQRMHNYLLENLGDIKQGFGI